MTSDNNNNKQSTEKTLIEKIGASVMIGSSRVVLTFLAGHPFDLIKTQMQADPNIRSAWSLSKDIYKNYGFSGFYKAGIPNFTRTFIKEAYRSPQRGFTKMFLDQSLPSFDGKKSFVNTATGLVMAATDTFIVCPLERIKVWTMTNYSKDKNIIRFFKELPNGASVGSELFRGLKPAFVRSGMSWTSYLLAEEKIWEAVKHLSPRAKPTDEDLPLPEKVLVGGLSGVVNCLSTLPFDTVKTKMQQAEGVQSRKIFEVIKQIYLQHGMRGLYTGWQARLPHFAIVGVLTSHVMHEVDKVWTPPKPTATPPAPSVQNSNMPK